MVASYTNGITGLKVPYVFQGAFTSHNWNVLQLIGKISMSKRIIRIGPYWGVLV